MANVDQTAKDSSSEGEYFCASETVENGDIIVEQESLIDDELSSETDTIPGGSIPNSGLVPRSQSRNKIKDLEYELLSPLNDDNKVDVNSDTGSGSGTTTTDASTVEKRPSVEETAEALDSLLILKTHRKHVFILSEAGKPIYTRHGIEEDLSGFFAVIQALTAFSEVAKDDLEFFRCGQWKIIFMHRSPLILAAASSNNESASQLRIQLDLLYYQIISLLTRTQLTKVFDQRKNFDLRRLLSGTEKTFRSIVSAASKDPSLMLNAVRCLHMERFVRDGLSQAIVSSMSSSKIKNVVFAMVIARDQLVTLVRMKKFTLHPSDLHLLINLVACNPSFRNSETWSPICLPRFDDTGFLHAHISYLSDSCPACLLMLTIDRQAFFELKQVKAKIVEKLEKNRLLSLISGACKNSTGVRISEAGIPDLWHFLYKNRTSSQLCSGLFEPPYVSIEEKRQLIRSYMSVIDSVHYSDDFSFSKSPLKICFAPGERQTILAWVTTNFELYTAFSPMVQKHSAMSKADRLIKWLKKEEEKLFILSSHFF